MHFGRRAFSRNSITALELGLLSLYLFCPEITELAATCFVFVFFFLSFFLDRTSQNLALWQLNGFSGPF